MKKRIFILGLALLYSFVLYAAPNYNNGNGTILFEEIKGNKKTEIRKLEMEITETYSLNDESKIIYDDYKTCKEIGRINSNSAIKTFEICTIHFTENPSDRWGNPYGERWYKIQSGKLIGWIYVKIQSKESFSDPFYNNRFEIIDILDINGKKTNVRKQDQIVSVWENLNIRNLPTTKNSSVLYTIHPGNTDPIQTNVNVIGMSDERINIDGKSDYWLKIKYKDYEGWIFGGYTSVERGGPKYYIPEWFAESDFAGL